MGFITIRRSRVRGSRVVRRFWMVWSRSRMVRRFWVVWRRGRYVWCRVIRRFWVVWGRRSGFIWGWSGRYVWSRGGSGGGSGVNWCRFMVDWGMVG